MTAMNDAAHLRAAATYNAAADHYDTPHVQFWYRHGQETIDRLQLRAGDRVLDVGCGTGASALPAAKAVGPGGRVLGIDIAEEMIRHARRRAEALALDNATFALADMANSGAGDGTYDAVVSVFSVFFVPDTVGQVRELWRLVRPGGTLAVTVWGQRAFEPMASIFAEEVRRHRPDLFASARPWQRYTRGDALRQLLIDGGTAEPELHRLDHSQSLASPGDCWFIAMGSGFRGEIEHLNDREKEDVKAGTAARLANAGISEICTDALLAIAKKPAAD